MDCSLCQPLDDDEVWTGPHWRVIVNRNQTTLGNVFVVPIRHETDIVNLTDDEVLALWTAIRSVKDVLVSRFQPDTFDYAFQMNQASHVHLHVIPRYTSPRDFAGQTFEDGDALEQRPLSPEVYQEIVSAIREGFAGNFI